MQDRTNKEVTLDGNLSAALLDICKEIDKEDEEVYNDIVRSCIELEHYWKGEQFLFFDGAIYLTARQMNEEDYEQFEQIVNIYKAHGESVIAALAMEVPNVGFFPADAKNPSDISTATGYTKLSRIVAQENRAPLLLVKALTILFNGGLIAGYNYHERNEKYGFIEVEEVETERVDVPDLGCPLCGAPLEGGQPMCPQCQAPLEGLQPVQIGSHQEENITRQETKQYPKGKEKLRVFGPSFIKLPVYVSAQDECGYCRLSYEMSVGLARSIYKKDIRPTVTDDDFARQMRIGLLYGGNEPTNVCTVKMYWIRPYYFYTKEIENGKALEAKFKNGCFAIVINGEVIKVYEESIDEHWTLSENPLYPYIYAQPMGKSLKPIQDKRNDEDKMVDDTLRHGIPFTIADAEALDWKKFREAKVKPGDIFPGKAPFGKAIADGFHTIKTSTVPQEITQISKRTEEAGQFVVGSYPSIYGGPSEGGSRTYAEYAMSRNQALQRLSIHWKTIVDWWTRMMERAVSSRAKNLDGDEQFTDKVADDFVSVFVRKAELDGKIGRVVSEASERLPLSWMQKKDQIMELMQLKDENINAALFHPENVNLLALLFGFPELFIPNSDQRLKQLNEIKELAENEPVQIPGQPDELGNPGQSQMQSTVPIEPDVDDNQVHSFTCASWLVSERGQLLRRENPAAYQNIIAHKKEHDAAIAQQEAAIAAQQMQQQEQNQDSKNNSEKTEKVNA